MYKGTTVILLPHCPALGTYGINYGVVTDIDGSVLKIQLCNVQKTVVTVDSKYVTEIDRSKIPQELSIYIPCEQMTDGELRTRLETLDAKITAIGIKLGL